MNSIQRGTRSDNFLAMHYSSPSLPDGFLVMGESRLQLALLLQNGGKIRVSGCEVGIYRQRFPVRVGKKRNVLSELRQCLNNKRISKATDIHHPRTCRDRHSRQCVLVPA